MHKVLGSPQDKRKQTEHICYYILPLNSMQFSADINVQLIYANGGAHASGQTQGTNTNIVWLYLQTTLSNQHEDISHGLFSTLILNLNIGTVMQYCHA